MIIKITIVLFVITVIYTIIYRSYLKRHPFIALKIEVDDKYSPWYVTLGGFLVLLCMFMILADVIWFLFFSGVI